MAIFSVHAKIIGKGQKKGGAVSVRGAVAAAAYRAGAVLRSVQEGVSYDYSKKQGIIHSEILLPVGAPERLRDRQTLWNEVEATEKHRNAQYSRELVIALPVELSHEENIRLARSYIRKTFVEKGMAADFAFHDPDPKSGQRNPHIHVMLTMRGLTLDGNFGKKNRRWNDRNNVQGWRERWAQSCNKWLEKGGFTERVDHRSYKEQGIDKTPTVHMGTEAAAMERKGIRTIKGDINRNIRAYDAAKVRGIGDPNLLASNARRWQVVRDLRGGAANSRAVTERAKGGSLPGEDAGLPRPGSQRRTYTSLCDVVRQGRPPALPSDGENALRGDEKRTEHEEKSAHRDEASARPAPKPSIAQRLKDATSGKCETDQPPGEKKKPALYDIKVMASALNFLSEHGVGSYAQLEEKLSALSGKLDAGEGALSSLQDEMAEARRLSGVASAGAKAQAEADQLRPKAQRAERLHGASLRIQANRQYAEEYEKKGLLKGNYYKKFADKIDTYHRAAAELKVAGFSENIAPEQLRQSAEGLNRRLKQQYQKSLWAVNELKAGGFELSDGPLLQRRTADLQTRSKALGQELYKLHGELAQWQRIKDTVSNVLEGKAPRAERQQQEQSRNGKQKTPDREGRGR